jgi:hypothetical protein
MGFAGIVAEPERVTPSAEGGGGKEILVLRKGSTGDDTIGVLETPSEREDCNCRIGGEKDMMMAAIERRVTIRFRGVQKIGVVLP